MVLMGKKNKESIFEFGTKLDPKFHLAMLIGIVEAVFFLIISSEDKLSKRNIDFIIFALVIGVPITFIAFQMHKKNKKLS